MNQNQLVPPSSALNESWTINETISAFPETIAVFNHMGVDTCCGGDSTIAEAAVDAEIEADALLQAVRVSIQATGV